MTAGTLLIMLKAPVAGNVKTRLGAEIGYGRAAALFRIMTRQTIARVSEGPWETVLAVDPPSAIGGFQALWPPHFMRTPQVKGDLGERMSSAMNDFPDGPVVIIGADAPGVRARQIMHAFKALRGTDAVFGPAEDGGYWLIGLARRSAAPMLFHNVRWSTKHALDDTLATLPHRFTVALIDQLSDVDVADDLRYIGSLSTR